MRPFPQQRPGRLAEYQLSHGADAAKLALFFEHFSELEPVHSKGGKVFTYAWKKALLFKYYGVADIRSWSDPRWQREHQALKRLNGEGAPPSFGFAIRKDGLRRDIIACREFVDGEHVDMIAADQAALLADLFARVHKKSVTTEDPVYNNFLQQGRGFILIDLDQAKLHEGGWKRAFFTGKELANIRLKVLYHDMDVWRAFKGAYHKANPARGIASILRRLGFCWWYSKKLTKYRLPVWLGRKQPEEGQSQVGRRASQSDRNRISSVSARRTARALRGEQTKRGQTGPEQESEKIQGDAMKIVDVSEALKVAGIRTESSERELETAAKDASQLKSSPLLVVYPDSSEEIAAIVRICGAAGLPISIAGGYTGLSGGALGYKAVRIETRQLNGFEIDGNSIRAQAGASVPAMIRACAAQGLVFPCQPASACRTDDVYEYLGTLVGPVTLGGSLGANASGLVGCKLGAALPWVRQLIVAHPGGSLDTVTDNFEHYVGTEGRYGIITDAVLELAPVPDDLQTYLVSGTGLATFTKTAAAIGASGALPLLAETMLMAADPPDFPGLARRIFDQAEDFLARFGSVFRPQGWLVLLQGSPDETGACLKSIGDDCPEAAVQELDQEDFDRIKQIRSAASDEIGSGVENPDRNPDDAPPVQRAARFLAEAIDEFMQRGIRPKAEHNYGMLRVFLETDEERGAYRQAIADGEAFDDGSLALHSLYHGDLAVFLEALLAPRVTAGMREKRIAVNFPGNEDILIPIDRFEETIELLGRLMAKYNACPVPLYYCHINFRRQPGWVLLHNRLLIDVAEFEEEDG